MSVRKYEFLFVKMIEDSCISIKDKLHLNMNETFLSTILTQSLNKDIKADKSQLLKRIEDVYLYSYQKLSENSRDLSVIQQYQKYCQQLKDIVVEHLTASLSSQSTVESSRAQSVSEDHSTQQQLNSAIQQQKSDYMFLRNVWQSKYSSTHNYDPEDHIDRINKVVAMVRMRTNYSIKKETFLYDRQEITNSYLLENPVFLKMKEQLQKMTMKNEELSQRCHFQSETIARLQAEKSALLENFTKIKKKLQQTEKNFIEVSKKNICLEQDSLALKSQSSKTKLNTLRESTDFDSIPNMDLKRSTSFSRFAQEAKMTQRSTQASQCTIKQTGPLENVFIDISLNMKSNRESRQGIKQPKTTNSRYMSNTSQNEQNTLIDVHRERANNLNQNLQILALCRSQRLITDQSPMRLKYIRNNDNSSARKTLLSSAKSVDLVDKTSLNKPKFQRTKPNYQHLVKSVKKDQCILQQTHKPEKSSLLTKKSVLNDNNGQTKLFREIREQIIQRQPN